MVEDPPDPAAERRPRVVGRRRLAAHGHRADDGPLVPMIGSVRPSRFAYTTADDGIRPVASDTRTPRSTAPRIAATVRSEISKSWSTIVPSMSSASSRIGSRGSGLTAGR